MLSVHRVAVGPASLVSRANCSPMPIVARTAPATRPTRSPKLRMPNVMIAPRVATLNKAVNVRACTKPMPLNAKNFASNVK
jgi:hypothetical protein